MFKSDTMYTNRYSDSYMWEVVDDTTYKFIMEDKVMKYCRFGGRHGQSKVVLDDLGMFDPSGGPYVALGMEIDGKPITRLYSGEDGMYAECKDFVQPGSDCQV